MVTISPSIFVGIGARTRSPPATTFRFRARPTVVVVLLALIPHQIINLQQPLPQPFPHAYSPKHQQLPCQDEMLGPEAVMEGPDFCEIINKTYMASIAKRKEQVNELRKAHFPFGFEDNKGALSEYRKEYNEQPLSVPQPNGDKGSHFTIASDEPAMANNTYQSEFKQKYPEHPNVRRDAAKRSIEENNIVLGFGGVPAATNYKDDFTHKTQSRPQPVNQRIISVELGDALTDFTTSYNRAHDGSQGERVQRNPNNNTAATNLVLGYDSNPFLTTNAVTHNPKPIPSASGAARSYATNISLGSDQGNFHSEHKVQFAHKSSNKQTVDRETVRDFKNAHFQLGFPEQSAPNLSEAQAHYNQKPLQSVKVEGRKPVNVQLRHDNNQYFQSSYGEHFQEKKGEPAEILNKNGRNSSVVIGMGTETFTTEAKDQFGQKTAERIRGKGAENSLSLGDANREYVTHYQDTHNDKHGQREGNRVSKEEIARMRTENFVKGFNDLDYKLHSHSYGAQGGEGNRLPREVIDKMRSTNIINSDNNAFHGSTTHKAAYSWKKNNDF